MYKTHSRSNTPASRPRRRSQHAHARTRTHQMRRPAKLLQPQITVDYTAWINPFRLRHLFRNKPVEHHRKHARAHLHRTRARARPFTRSAPQNEMKIARMDFTTPAQPAFRFGAHQFSGMLVGRNECNSRCKTKGVGAMRLCGRVYVLSNKVRSQAKQQINHRPSTSHTTALDKWSDVQILNISADVFKSWAHYEMNRCDSPPRDDATYK